jgi:hypothetical protein
VKEQMSWRMEWRVGMYGSLNPSRARRVVTDAVLASVLFATYGIWTEFVPSEPVATAGGYLAAALSLSAGLFISHGFATGRFQWFRRPGLPGRLFCYAFFTVFVYCVSWPVLVRAAPDVLTRIFGAHQSKSMILEFHDHSRWRHGSRGGCRYRLQGEELAFPGYVCVPYDAGPFAPRGEVILSGKATFLGLHVSRMEPRLDPTKTE